MSLICLVTAMTAEAKPLVQALHLQRLPQSGLSAWMGDGVCLLQTGMGAQRAGARLESMLAAHPNIDAFINVGVAGGNRELGDVVIGSSVQDQLSERRWYPHLPSATVTDGVDHCEVITVASPCDHYHAHCVYDMEAAAIANVASRHTDLSRSQTVKVISDNPERPMDDFSVKNVTAWMCNTLPTVEALIDWLSTSGHHNVVTDFRHKVHSLTDHITGVCHHSVTQTHQLRRLLERYFALHGQLPTLDHLGQLDSSASILTRLENELYGYAVNY